MATPLRPFRLLTGPALAFLLGSTILVSLGLPSYAQSTDAPSDLAGATTQGGSEAAEGGPAAVDLLDSGLAWMVWDLKAGEGEDFIVPRDRLDRFLASFTVMGRGVAAPQLSLAGPGSMADRLEGLHFSPEDFSSTETLLRALIGHRVFLGTARPLQGVVMGVSRTDTCDAGSCATLMLDTEQEGMGRIRAVEIDQITELQAADPVLAAEISRILTEMAQSRNEDQRRITLSLKKTQEDAQAYAGFMTPATPWKITWRAMLGAEGEGRLQGWAVIHNDTGEDWRDVTLSLSTGSPQVIETALFDPAPVASTPMPMALSADAPMMEAFSARAAGAGAMADMGMIPMAPEPVVQDGEGTSRYTLPDPMSLDAGQMMSIPILDQPLEGKRLTLYRGGQMGQGVATAPDLVLRVNNDLGVRIPEGVASISDPTGVGFMGNARIPQLLPGEERLVTFARDDRLTVTETSQQERISERLNITGATLFLEEHEIIETTYRIEAQAEVHATDMVIDHPDFGSGWETPETNFGTPERYSAPGQTPVWRIAFPITPDGLPEALRVRDTMALSTSILLRDMDANTVLYWRGRAANPAVIRVLEAYAELLEEERLARTALETLQSDLARQSQEQKRQLEVMSQFERGTEEHRRFSTEIIALEDRIQDLNSQEADLLIALTERRADVQAFLAEMEMP